MSKPDYNNVSREGRQFLKSILLIYVKDMINENDYERLQSEILDVMRAERQLARRCPKGSR